MVANYLPEGVNLILQSENGMLGTGPFPYEGEADPDVINAGKQTVTELPETSYCSSADSFAHVSSPTTKRSRSTTLKTPPMDEG
jgi:3-oxoacid CoA-transferase subunit B